MVLVFFMWGCSKNSTKYYADDEDKGIAIFSNTENNIASVFIADKPWRTVSRTSSGVRPFTNYEVEIARLQANLAKDTLIIEWRGYYEADKNGIGYLSMHLALPANFSYKDLSALQGKRLSIDSTNGFFVLSNPSFNTNNKIGKGTIYFQTAQFDSSFVGGYTGKIAGLFDADFTSFKITRGRFDHFISPEQIRL